MRRPFTVLCLFMLVSCGDELPDSVAGYATSESCFKMNVEPIPVTEDDPHEGIKNVYACNVTKEKLVAVYAASPFTYPDGTLIVKESTKEHQSYRWLIATALKVSGSWEWKEYTRNFENEAFVQLPVPESVCFECHKKVAAADYIYTLFTP